MKYVEIPVFYHNDDTRVKDDVGIDYELSECDERVFTFFVHNIVAVTTSIEKDGKEYGRIIASGDSFVSPWSKEKVMMAILDV